MQVTQLSNLMVMMFLLITGGYLLAKKKIINAEVKQGITWLVLNLILPCNIFNSFYQTDSSKIMASFFTILVVSLTIQIGCYILSKVLYNTVPSGRKAVLQYATICSNAGFIGNPVAEGLYGSEGLLLASIYLIPQRIVMWSAGISCFTESKGWDTIKRVITHPCIIAVIIGMVVMWFKIPIPTPLLTTTKALGNCNTAMSMLLVGSILVSVNFKQIIDKTVLQYCAIRLLGIPLLVLLGCYLLNVESTISGISIVLAGMPAGATTAILAMQYGGDEQFAAKSIIASTVLSLLSIPILCYIVYLIF